MKASLFVVALIVLSCLRGVCQATMTQEQFLAEYEPAAERLRNFYSAATMSGTYTERFLNRVKSSTTRRRYTFDLYTSGDYLRVDTVQTEGDIKPGNAVRSVRVTGPNNSFALGSAKGADSYAVQVIRQANRGSSPSGIKLAYHGLFAAYCDMEGVAIVDLLRDRKTTIVGIEQEQRDGENLVTISMRYWPVVQGRAWPERAASFTFSRDRGWVLRAYEMMFAGKDDNVFSANIAYDGAIEGVPLLKEVDVSVKFKGKDYDMLALDVDSITPGTVPESEFTLAAFGLEDAEPGRVIPIWIVLNIVGILLLVAAIAVRRRGNRSRAQELSAG